MEFALITTFLLCAFLIVYHHVGYPILLRFWAARHPMPLCTPRVRHYQPQKSDRILPSVTIVVPAFNEARWIADKILNCASLDYPRSKMKVLIVSDGSTDKTVQIAEAAIQQAACSDTHFDIINNIDNKGKVAILNQYLPTISTDIICISDVSSLISVDALLVAAERFADPKVGVVNGTYQLLGQENSGEHAYWKYQNQIKLQESTIGSTIGSHGALYFVRSGLFEPLPANVINDDFMIPMRIVSKGYVAVYDPNMNAIELEATAPKQDFQRRLRISAGNMQQTLALTGLLSPQYGGTAFTFFSGKGLRVLTPYLMLVCLITSALLVNTSAWFGLALGAQLFVYGIAILGVIVPGTQTFKINRLITYLVVGHTANLIGGLRYLVGLERGRWVRISYQEKHHEKG
ncbi:glycosyltransferase family 2 protein [Vibrio hangzhouensis]|uniref:glycosyltransferase family 2 protein n=1 Tax=Vibrio hangzhouensis TaxID=462991 RepID=UPI001C96C622|nr:glycosyltransferase family 2 protein [Vibrio hangzhouensis]MBY6197889.1 glycosyltransferase family 2 protein [Vibrio hangzhouensis]